MSMPLHLPHRMTRGAKALVIFLIVLIASSARAFAWGYEGHRIIAEIAEQLLEPDTAHQIRDLLAIENVTTLADVSMWADEVRLQHPETAHWHFVNIPIHPSVNESESYNGCETVRTTTVSSRRLSTSSAY
jgi:hypothetical protein